MNKCIGADWGLQFTRLRQSLQLIFCLGFEQEPTTKENMLVGIDARLLLRSLVVTEKVG